MSTIIPFIPSNLKAPNYPVVLDGVNCNIIITWNVSAQRYYVNVYDDNNNWIITTPLISTPPGRNVDSVVYDPFLNQITTTFVDPSLWPIPLSPAGLSVKPGTMVDYTFIGFQPDTYNGKFRCMHVDPLTFTYPTTVNPGQLLVSGTVNRYLNMIESVAVTSTLTYRNSCFVVDP